MPKLKPVTTGFLLGALALAAVMAFVILGLSHLGARSVVRVNSKNPALQAAIGEARKGLDAFIKELSAPKSGEGFAVKGAFSTAEGPEYLWVRSPIFKDGAFTGKLDQAPIALVGKIKGDEVSVAKKDAVDWLINA